MSCFGLMIAYPATALVAVTPTEAAALPAGMIPAGIAANNAGIVPQLMPSSDETALAW